MNDIEYFEEFLSSIDTLSVKWNVDEQEADPFHRNFDPNVFVERLRGLVGTLKKFRKLTSTDDDGEKKETSCYANCVFQHGGWCVDKKWACSYRKVAAA